MIRNALKTTFALNIFGTSDVGSQDLLNRSTQTEKKADIAKIENETGWERVQRMFQVDEFGELSKEVVTVMHVGAMSLFVGALYGGVIHSRVAYMNFIKNNQATAFNDHLEAKKRLQDAVTKSFGKGAWKWAWRLSLFCSTFVGVSTTISVYRGKTGILDYVAAGLVSGSLYKLNSGPRGMIVGGGLGSVLGLMAGSVTLGILSLTGMTMEEARYWQYYWRQERQNYIQKSQAEYCAKEEGGMILYHNEKIGAAGKDLQNLEKRVENSK
ncbi:RPII140-upstream gene protein isoform X1 [Zophobas morio]|uniref:RPII140-upstream gene protein isoform X1 n=1 Tax=Zophobas morio TaxID=2755281 RepID=UPI00308367D8